VCFGVSNVLMNATLPVITAALPEVREKAAEVARLNAEGKHQEADQVAVEREALALKRSTEISSRGFASGYCAGVIGIIMCIPLVALLKSEVLAYQLCQVIAGVWWALWMILVAFRLLSRPGPPLPPGKCPVATEAFSSIYKTFRELIKLPRSFAYLVFWMFFSDGVFLVGSIGGLYANSRVDWGCFNKAYGVLLLFIIVPLTAMSFNLLYMKLAQRFKIPPQRMLQFCLFVIGIVVPVWGFVGIKTGLEVIIVGVIWAAHMGPMQAFSRSVFASLIPPGKEVKRTSSLAIRTPTTLCTQCSAVAVAVRCGAVRCRPS
jgi:UMF1 family MFS transporter